MNVKKSVINWVVSIIGLTTLILLVGSTVQPNTNNISENDSTKKVASTYKIKSLSIPLDLNFSGEPVPINREDVFESFDRELLVNTYWQSQTILFHKRANRWFPVIEPILKKNDIPDDFKYLALIESGLMHVVSPAGAAGYWQFLKTTAPEYGLEVNAFVDERYNVEKSTEAACKYLKKAYEKYGSWTMAAASYNLGMGGITKQINRQNETDYYNLLLPEETARYVFRILAAKEILLNSEKYGFFIEDEHLYNPFEFNSVNVNYTISDLVKFAQENNTTYKELKRLNPWLRDTQLPNNSGKNYVIYLPKN
jgi:membrane-bound lytic murein transglycosylase D